MGYIPIIKLRTAILTSFRRSRQFTGVQLLHMPYVHGRTSCFVVTNAYRLNGTIAINRYSELFSLLGEGPLFEEYLLNSIAWNTGTGTDQTPHRTRGACARGHCNLPLWGGATCNNEICRNRAQLDQLCSRYGLRLIGLGTWQMPYHLNAAVEDSRFFLDTAHDKAILFYQPSTGRAAVLADQAILGRDYASDAVEAIFSVLVWSRGLMRDINIFATAMAP